MQAAQITNTTKSVVIAQEAQVATSLWQRIKGLLGRESLPFNEALVLKPCSSIHTFFMRFPIDVLFLDKNMHIIKAIPNMPPNRFSPIVWRSRLVIELPAGKVGQTDTQPGDTISIKE